MIDVINPKLRSIDDVDGKLRKREFYALSPEEVYSMFESMAKVHGTLKNLKRYKKTDDEESDEKIATEAKELNANRHHFKEVFFSSSLTGKNYRGFGNEKGTLSIVDLDDAVEVPDFAEPSKKAIVCQAVKDLNGEITKKDTLYTAYHKLMKIKKA